MKSIPLSDEYELHFYHCDQGLHLMVWQDALALRCRKERVTAVRSLVSGEIETLGKVGLQLRRDGGNSFHVVLKQKTIGTISQGVLEEALDDLSFGKLQRIDDGNTKSSS